MAQRLDDAFAGCEEWTIAPPSSRRDTLDVDPWLAKAERTQREDRLPRAA